MIYDPLSLGAASLVPSLQRPSAASLPSVAPQVPAILQALHNGANGAPHLSFASPGQSPSAMQQMGGLGGMMSLLGMLKGGGGAPTLMDKARGFMKSGSDFTGQGGLFDVGAATQGAGWGDIYNQDAATDFTSLFGGRR
jgi:hypothetical protein